MSALVKLLRAARKRIAPRGSWCQGSYRRDSRGRPTAGGPTEPRPCSWCAEGAVFDVRGWDHIRAIGCLEAAACAYVPDFNDAPHRQQRDVLRMYDRAIAVAQRQAKRGRK